MMKANTGKTPFNRKAEATALTPAERKQFKKLLDNSYMSEVAEHFGVTRQTLSNINRVGSGSAATIGKIRKALNFFTPETIEA